MVQRLTCRIRFIRCNLGMPECLHLDSTEPVETGKVVLQGHNNIYDPHGDSLTL